MDVSPEYVKMCEKAEEIQAERELKEGDWYAYLRPVEGAVCGFHTRQEFLDNPNEGWAKSSVCMVSQNDNGELGHVFTPAIEHCWLPRQDQLQEMLGIPWQQVLVGKFAGFVASQLIPNNGSMEQLWLAFVMREHFGKIWSGTDWTKEKGIMFNCAECTK